jgi:hypothetical protein
VNRDPEERESPAARAGTSTEHGPGIPDDFAGDVAKSLPLTQEEVQSLAKAKALDSARNHARKRTDLGFGAAASKDAR